MAGNPSFDTLISTTLDSFIPTLVDQIFTSKPFLWILQTGGHIKNRAGGRHLNVELLYASAKNVGSYAGSDTFATEDDDEVTVAQYSWKQLKSYSCLTPSRPRGRALQAVPAAA